VFHPLFHPGSPLQGKFRAPLSETHAFVEGYFVPVQLALAMLGMGATLSVQDFVDVVRDVRGLVLGLALQLVLVPAMAWAFIAVLGLSPGWAVGLVLVAVVPGGAFSNLLTFLGHGNTALSISVTAATTALCVVTIPVLLRVLAAAHLPVDFGLPTQRVVFEIGAYLMAPLIIGMAIYRARQKPALVISRWAVRGSMLLIVLITVSALQSGRIRVGAYGWGPPIRIVLFGVILAWLTPYVVRLFRRYDDDNVALTVEVAVRNIGIALLLVRFFFPGTEQQGHVLYTCLFYAGLSGFLAAPVVIRHRFRQRVLPIGPRRPRPK